MASYPSGSRGRFAKPLFTGSNPVDASNLRFAAIGRRLSARVVKLVDTRDLKSLARFGHVGSSPTPGTSLRLAGKTTLFRLHFIIIQMVQACASSIYDTTMDKYRSVDTSDPGYLCFHDEKDSSLFHKLRKHVLFINYQILQILCNETGYRMGYRPHSPKPATFPCFYVISHLTQNR